MVCSLVNLSWDNGVPCQYFILKKISFQVESDVLVTQSTFDRTL
jgi:hypothetical protein